MLSFIGLSNCHTKVATDYFIFFEFINIVMTKVKLAFSYISTMLTLRVVLVSFNLF